MVERERPLLDAFPACGLPGVPVNVIGGAPSRTEQPSGGEQERPAEFAERLPAFGQRPGDILVTKREWGVFAGTDLGACLRARSGLR